MRLRKVGKILVIAAAFLGLTALGGCTVDEQDDTKVKDLDFTVLKESEIPEDIMALIEERKGEEFKVTKTSEPYTYIIVGYGEQKTSGYSVQVEELYLGENAIYVDTELMGPAKDEAVKEEPTYPYIVIKMEQRDEPIIFK